MLAERLYGPWRRSKIVAVACALLLFTAACGASTGEGGDSETGGGDSETIVLGSVCTCSGPAASSQGFMPKVIDAWVEYTNATGGINGHPVEVIQIDDAGDEAKNLQAVRKLVDQDEVQAMVSYQSTVTAGAAYLKQKGIPVIGLFDSTGGSLYFPTYFPVGGLTSIQAQAFIGMAQDEGKKKFGTMYCVEAPGCKLASDEVRKVAESAGVGYHDVGISLSAADYTAPCLAMKEEGVEALFVQAVPSVYPKVLEQCASQQYEPMNVTIFAAINAGSLKDPIMEGVYFWTPQANYQDETIPGVKTFADAMRKYANEIFTSDEFSHAYSNSWASLQMFRAAAEAGDVGPDSDYEDVLNGLYALKDETLDGLTPPQTYEEGKFIQPNCYFTVQIQNGEFVGGDEPTCVDPSLVN